MKHTNKYIYFFIVIALLGCLNSSCNLEKTLDSEKDMVEWMNDDDHGLVKKYDTENLSFTIKYLPPSYLLYNEVKKLDVIKPHMLDSMKSYYTGTMTFILTVDFKKAIKGDNVLLDNAGSFEEYKSMIENLNFSLNDYVTLKYGDKEEEPLLWDFQNTYTLGSERTLYLVFKKPDLKKDDHQLKVVFNDEIFYTGVNTFLFDSRKLNDFPMLAFYKKPKDLLF